MPKITRVAVQPIDAIRRGYSLQKLIKISLSTDQDAYFWYSMKGKIGKFVLVCLLCVGIISLIVWSITALSN